MILRSARFDDFEANDNVEDVYEVDGSEVVVRAGEPVPPGGTFLRRQSIPERAGESRLGDGDPFVDAGELINLDIVVENATSEGLTNVEVSIHSDGLAIACITDSSALYGTLRQGESRFNPLDDRFQFIIDTNEAAQSHNFSTLLRQVNFVISIKSDQFTATRSQQNLTLVLDLDVLAGAGQTPRTFHESFEDPVLGENLTIEDMATQPCPDDASQTAAECVRGQFKITPSVVCPFDEQFLPGLNVFIRPERQDWHVHTRLTPDLSGTGKAYTGINSLHWGRHTFDWRGNPGDTVCIACGYHFIGPDLNINTEGDTVMSFWHITEFCDEDCWAFVPDTADEYSVVQVRPDNNFDPSITGFGAWERVEPFFGVFDGTQDTFYSSPTFEPSDDINPGNLERPLVTTCLPLTVWLSQGSARGIDAVNCTDGDGNGFSDCGHGELEDNPVLRTPDRLSRGEEGVGVWVHTKINLNRYAGRHIQYRFVPITFDDGLNTFISYLENVEGGAPSIAADSDIDDGWYIDEIAVTNTVANEIQLGIDTTPGRDGSAEGIAACPFPPGDDIVSFEWFEDFGRPSETFIGMGEILDVTLPLGMHTITLRVMDRAGAADTDEVIKTIADTTPPDALVSVAPQTLWPPNHRMVDIEALVSARDLCSTPALLLNSVASDEPDDAESIGDGKTVNDIQGEEIGTADFQFQLRAERAGGGGGRIYTVTYVATDSSGNQAAASAGVVVPHDLDGVTEPLAISARENGADTVVEWNEVAGALFYTVAQGDLKSLNENEEFIDLGAVSCIEANSTGASTLGHEDSVVPAAGEAFFYLIAYNDGQDSSYGTVEVPKPRKVASGQCPY